MHQPSLPNLQGRPRVRPALRGLALGILAAVLALTSPPGGAAGGRLQNAAPSVEALAARVLAAMVQGDFKTLRGLALSEEEFRQHVWPELPVSDARTNVSFDYVWNEVAYRSTLWMNRLVKDLSGRNVKRVRVSHHGKAFPYRSHRAWSDMTVVLADESGQVREYPLFGTLIEMDRRFKVYSYAPYD